MLNFAGITHVIENQKGHAPGWNYSLVGSVPASMMDLKPATQSDVMGGRAHYAADGSLVAYKSRQWSTVADILAEADKHPDVKMCTAAGCACREHFGYSVDMSGRLAPRRQAAKYDYDNQAWIVNGKYVCCGHPETMNCGCYGREHAGESAPCK